MKKTLLLLSFIALPMAYGETLTKIADMQTLANAATLGGATVSTTYETTVENGAVYTFGNGTYLGGISNDAVKNALTSTSYVTVAAWVYFDTLPTTKNSLFSYGTQSTGIKFDVQNNTLSMTTKGVSDFATSGGFSGLKAGEWVMIAYTIPGGSNTDETKYSRLLATATDGQYYSKGTSTMAQPAANAQLFAIGSGNQGSARETFTGQIANLTVFTSSGLVTNPELATALGAAPTLKTPEPATATLSLLALAGLAARRRRH